MQELLKHMDSLHTTPLGSVRIRKNTGIETEDVMAWCKAQIASPHASFMRKGKNWYVDSAGYIFTIHACSYTIITVHAKNVKKASYDKGNE